MRNKTGLKHAAGRSWFVTMAACALVLASLLALSACSGIPRSEERTTTDKSTEKSEIAGDVWGYIREVDLDRHEIVLGIPRIFLDLPIEDRMIFGSSDSLSIVTPDGPKNFWTLSDADRRSVVSTSIGSTDTRLIEARIERSEDPRIEQLRSFPDGQPTQFPTVAEYPTPRWLELDGAGRPRLIANATITPISSNPDAAEVSVEDSSTGVSIRHVVIVMFDSETKVGGLATTHRSFYDSWNSLGDTRETKWDISLRLAPLDLVATSVKAVP